MIKHPVSRKSNLVIQEMDGEVLIYDLAENKVFCLNKTSALVWQCCDGSKSIDEICEFISQKLNLPANKELIQFALDQLKKENLLENSGELPNHFAGMSRRQIIRKVGLETMIALPIISHLVAPTAYASVSICGPVGAGAGNNEGDACYCLHLPCDAGDSFSVSLICDGDGFLGSTVCNSNGRTACMCFATACSGFNNRALGTCA